MHIVDIYFSSQNQAQPPAQPLQIRKNVEKSLWHLFEESYSEKFSLDIENNPYHIYLSPNETYPERMASHLKSVPHGYTIGTGAERNFFTLALADPAKTQGVVIVDLNHCIKAYNDFLVLLLAISETKEAFQQLSEPISEQQIESVPQLIKRKWPSNEPIYDFNKKNCLPFGKRVEQIREKLAIGSLPDRIKKYYEKNLESCAKVYFSPRNYWRNNTTGAFEGVGYHQNDLQFKQLHHYALSGNIVSVIGNFEDLGTKIPTSLPIGLLDVSNIPESTYKIDLLSRIAPFCILHTNIFFDDQTYNIEKSTTRYRFCLHSSNDSLSKKDEDDLDDIFALYAWIWKKLMDDSMYTQTGFVGYNQNTLKKARQALISHLQKSD